MAKEAPSFEQVHDTTVANLVGTSPIASKQELAAEIKVGMRIPSHKVLNQADARPWHLQELLRSDGRWRIIIFPGDLGIPENLARLTNLCEKLDNKNSFLRRFTPQDLPVDSVIEVLTVHAASRESVELLDLPQILHPFTDIAGHDYWKVFVDDQSYHESHGNAYKSYGICSNRGAIVIIRPDQYVSWVGESNDYDSMDRFFSAFMKVQ